MSTDAALAEAQFNLGISHFDDGDFGEAAKHFQAAIEAAPFSASAHNNLGSAFGGLGRFGDAADAFHRAVQIDSSYVEAYFNLGIALLRLGRFPDSLSCFARTVELDANHADAYNGIGAALVQLNRGQEAIPFFRQALDRNPNHSLARAQLMFQLAQLCEWDQLEDSRPLIATLGIVGPPVPPFTLLSFDDNPQRHRERSARYAAENFGGIDAAPSRTPPAARPDRLRIGYFSSDFHDHATMFLAAKMFEAHDRERFSVHCYSYGKDSDGPMRRRLRAAVNGFQDIGAMDDPAAAAAARSDCLDIAIDLKGFTRGNRLGIFAHRAAPIQISFLGYPGTSGAPFIDYLIVDPVVVPKEHRDAFSERLITLPHSYQPNDPERAIAETPTRLDLGLPAKGFVFCCFNASYKITPVEFDIWMTLLRKVEGSVLWLIATQDRVKTNLRTAAAARGVEPGRIVFGPRLSHHDHLARHRMADLFLDTFNCNAHTTASDALWAGLPVVTKLGDSFAARVAGSLLRAAGLEEMTTESVEQYADLALNLATNPVRLGQARAKLSANRAKAPLFDSELFTRHLEAGYDLAFDRWLIGKAAADIRVKAN